MDHNDMFGMNKILQDTFNLSLKGGWEMPAPEWQRKGAIIQDINTIQLEMGKSPVDEHQFEMLMKLDIDHLTRIVNDQASTLDRAKVRL